MACAYNICDALGTRHQRLCWPMSHDFSNRRGQVLLCRPKKNGTGGRWAVGRCWRGYNIVSLVVSIIFDGWFQLGCFCLRIFFISCKKKKIKDIVAQDDAQLQYCTDARAPHATRYIVRRRQSHLTKNSCTSGKPVRSARFFSRKSYYSSEGYLSIQNKSYLPTYCIVRYLHYHLLRKT